MVQFTTPTGAYHITNHGNGWAYDVMCTTSRGSLWFQDKDAYELRHRSENFTDEDAIRAYFDNPYLVLVESNDG